MEKLTEAIFDKVYGELIYKDDAFVTLNNTIDGMIKDAILQNGGGIGQKQMEAISDQVVGIAAEAQKGGYRIGLVHAFKLIFQILSG